MSTMTEKQLKTLGEKFIELSGMFLRFIERNGLDKTLVNMRVASDSREDVTPLCETPLCHGGWLAVMFEQENIMQNLYIPSSNFYVKGATQAAEFLGFTDKGALTRWADNSPELWETDFGCCIFSDAIAFDEDDPDRLTLTDIANHYAAVGKRCITESKMRTNKGEDQ